MYRRHLEKLARTRLDDVLLDEGIVERRVVEDAQIELEMTGAPLSQLLFDRDALDEWELARIVATQYSLPFIDPTRYSIPREAEETLSADFCRKNAVLPIDLFGESVAIAVTEMPSAALLNQICELSKRTPFLYVAVRRQVMEVLDERAKRNKDRNPEAEAGPRVAARPKRAAAEPSPTPNPAPVSIAPDVVASVIEHASLGAAPEPEVEPWEPVDLPPVTMKLGSSMQGVGANAVATAAVRPASRAKSRRAPAKAATRPTSTPADASKPASTKPVSTGPVATKPAVAKPRQQRHPEQRHPDPKPAPAKPQADKASASESASGDWRSIFDIGDDAVKGD